jgi:hypothetical protein
VIPHIACNPVVLDLPDALLMKKLILIIGLLCSRIDCNDGVLPSRGGVALYLKV